jgi:hypothetical protein
MANDAKTNAEGSICLRATVVSGFCEHGKELLDFMRVSWKTEPPLASQACRFPAQIIGSLVSYSVVSESVSYSVCLFVIQFVSFCLLVSQPVS